MKASAPKTNIWIIGLLLGILGIVSHFIDIKYVTEYQFWILAGGFVLLALGTTFKGL